MKFRAIELFLGMFLAIAIFAMGMLFASPLTLQVQNAAPHQTTEHQAASKISEDGDKTQSLWVPTDSVGLYTLVLAFFTALLVGVSSVQGYFLLRADKTARIAANAADLSARAAVAIALPIIRAVPEGFSFGTSLEGDNTRREYCLLNALMFSNLGTTKAFPIEVRCGWTVGDKLPDAPVYTFTKSFPIDIILEPDPKVKHQLHVNEFSVVLSPGDREQTREGKFNMWFYCCIVYLDFMQTRHESGFCWSRYDSLGSGGLRVDATPAYNRKA